MVASLSPAVAAVFVVVAVVLTGSGATGVIAPIAGMEIGSGWATAARALGVVACRATCSVGTGGGGTTAWGGGRMVACSESGIGTWMGNGVLGSSANNRIARLRLRVSAIASERVACGAHSKERVTAIDVISHLLAVRNVAKGTAARRPGRFPRYAWRRVRTSAGIFRARPLFSPVGAPQALPSCLSRRRSKSDANERQHDARKPAPFPAGLGIGCSCIAGGDARRQRNGCGSVRRLFEAAEIDPGFAAGRVE